MSVSLNNLNISLDDFNAAASGKYNIGQIKLNEDGTGVYRTNSHKTFTILNKTEISKAEAFAVKEAFCRAVKNEAKLDDAAVQELKEKLGIGSSRFSLMKAGAMKALTAAEVREVIDKYADQINQSRAEGAQLKTSADLYRGVSQKTLDSRAKARDKVNAQTLAKFAPSEADKALNSVVDLVEYEGGDSVSDETRRMAKGLFKHLQVEFEPGTEFVPYKKAPVSFLVKSDNTLSAKVKLDNGSGFSIDLGLTQKQMRDKMMTMVGSLAVDARFARDAAKLDEEKGLAEKPMEETEEKPVDPLSLSKPQVDELKTKVLKFIKKSFDTLKTIDDQKDPKALKAFREGLIRDGNHCIERMDKIVEDLQFALVAVRGHDPRNARLVNKVRDAFLHDANATAPVDRNALCDKLYEEISEVLNKERTNLRDVVDDGPATNDDGFETLNINQLTGD